jgi:Fur family ferric uptake transcriptional regulator
MVIMKEATRGQLAQFGLSGVRRQTAQRHQITRIMEEAKGPLSAEEIYCIALAKRPDIGRATVYRTLKIMQDENKVRFVCLPDGVARYEKAGPNQHHFQCRLCREVWTIKSEWLGPLRSVTLESGFTIEDYSSTFYGYCPRCQAGRCG